MRCYFSSVPFVPLIGLIWATGQILQRALPQRAKAFVFDNRREKIGTFVGFDLVAWAIFVGLALDTPSIPSPINLWLALGISVVFSVYLGYRYFPRGSNLPARRLSNKQFNAKVSRLLLFQKFSLVLCCVLGVERVQSISDRLCTRGLRCLPCTGEIIQLKDSITT